MYKFDLTTTGRQAEFLERFLPKTTEGVMPQAVMSMENSFRKQIRILPVGKRVTIYVTHFPELCQLNGLSCPVDDRAYMNLAVPNFLAERLGLEPMEHELALEVFGQGLHYTAIPEVKNGFVICSNRANQQPCEWDNDKVHLLYDEYRATAIRLEQKQFGCCVSYPTSHVARSEENMLLLYVKRGTLARLFGPSFGLMGM